VKAISNATIPNAYQKLGFATPKTIAGTEATKIVDMLANC
jgi:hypothetical protein